MWWRASRRRIRLFWIFFRCADWCWFERWNSGMDGSVQAFMPLLMSCLSRRLIIIHTVYTVFGRQTSIGMGQYQTLDQYGFLGVCALSNHGGGMRTWLIWWGWDQCVPSKKLGSAWAGGAGLCCHLLWWECWQRGWRSHCPRLDLHPQDFAVAYPPNTLFRIVRVAEEGFTLPNGMLYIPFSIRMTSPEGSKLCSGYCPYAGRDAFVHNLNNTCKSCLYYNWYR